MQLDYILTLIISLLIGRLSCSVLGENADREKAPHQKPNSKEVPAVAPPVQKEIPLPADQNSHPQRGQVPGVNQGEAAAAARDVDGSAGAQKHGSGEDNVRNHQLSGARGGQASLQQHRDEGDHRHIPAKPDALPESGQASPGTSPGRPEGVGQNPLPPESDHESGEHQYSEQQQRQDGVDKGENEAGVDGGLGGEDNEAPVLTVQTSAPSSRPGFAQDDSEAGEEQAAVQDGEDSIQQLSEPVSTSTSTTTASTRVTTDSPLMETADQIESPPTEAPPTVDGDSSELEHADAGPDHTGAKSDTVQGQLPSDSGGSELEKTTVTPEEAGEDGELKAAEDFPSFGEWRQKVLEEQEKEEKENQKQMAGGNGEGETQPTSAINSQKLRVNYAAKVCGSKVVASNPEMENGNHMLTANKDEYMINPCSARKWFVVELCEPVMVKMVELASLELFSSHPHSFRVALSDRHSSRYPTKEWVLAGTYDMTMDKVPQLFPLKVKSPYVKFVRIEMLDHFGNEHYCPVTLFRVFGVPIEDDDSEDNTHHAEGEDVFFQSEEEQSEGTGEAKTLFTRTKETVVNLVKKVLYKGEEQEGAQAEENKTAAEIRANVSGEGNLPCDPDFSDDSVPDKAKKLEVDVTEAREGADATTPTAGASEESQKTGHSEAKGKAAEVTAHQPQPTHTIMAGSTVRIGQDEIPMVTKLDDGDQVEIATDPQGGGGGGGAGGQGLVRLLQSGNGKPWGSALAFCHPKSTCAPLCCSYEPACVYVQTMLGEPPPISYPRPELDVTISPTALPSASASASSADLDPSFPHSVTATREVESSTRLVADDSLEDILQPSSRAGAAQVWETSAVETAAIPVDTLARETEPEVTTSDAGGEKKREAGASDSEAAGEIKNTVTGPSVNVLSSSSSSDVDIKSEKASGMQASEVDPSTFTRPRTASVEKTTDSQVQETNTDTVASSTTTSLEMGDDVMAAPFTTTTEGSSSQETQRVEQTPEILEPSIQLETTSVISPSLTRPTPVLEEERASAEGGDGKDEVRETAVPRVSPSPTSVSVEAKDEDASQSAFPEIMAPTIEPSQKAEMQMPTSELASSSGATGAAPAEPEAPVTQDKNATEKKTEDLDLVHIPLSVSAKRETAIMRLTNRIKALELNVSLSSRFLDELSTRFKKQNEELMKMLNKTVGRINATTTATQRQSQEHEVRIERLESRLDNLTLVVQQLSDRFDSFAERITDRQMIATSVNFLLLLVAVVIWLRGSKPPQLHPDVQFLLDTMPRRPQVSSGHPRRNSDVAVSGSSHDPDWGPGPILKKGGSATNLASVTLAGNLDIRSSSGQPSSEERRELGLKKKRRKKSKALKTFSMDLGSDAAVNLNNSQGLEVQTTAGVLFGVGAEGTFGSGVLASDGGSSGCSNTDGRQLGHRRWGSASGSIPSCNVVNDPPTQVQNTVQFLLGNKVIPPHIQSPQPVPDYIPDTVCSKNETPPADPTCPWDPLTSPHLTSSATFKPSVPAYQQSKITPSVSVADKIKTALFRSSRAEDVPGPMDASGAWRRFAVHSKSAELPRPPHLPHAGVSMYNGHHTHPTQNLPKPKKPISVSLPFLNGDRGTKGAPTEHPSSRAKSKGSSRGSGGGGGHEEGKGGAVKHEPSKFKGGGAGLERNSKPWRGQSF